MVRSYDLWQHGAFLADLHRSWSAAGRTHVAHGLIAKKSQVLPSKDQT